MSAPAPDRPGADAGGGQHGADRRRPRCILYAPGHINFDTSLSKHCSLAGYSNLEFRWDAFNLKLNF